MHFECRVEGVLQVNLHKHFVIGFLFLDLSPGQKFLKRLEALLIICQMILSLFRLFAQNLVKRIHFVPSSFDQYNIALERGGTQQACEYTCTRTFLKVLWKLGVGLEDGWEWQ